MEQWISVAIGSPWDRRPDSEPIREDLEQKFWMAQKMGGFARLGRRRGERVKAGWTGSRERSEGTESQTCVAEKRQ
jgi:hypothetical protein